MSDDINSPRVRQILAIHAEQAAEAKAAAQLAERTIVRVVKQRDELYALATSTAGWVLNKAAQQQDGELRAELGTRGWELHKLARGFTDNPGPCPANHNFVTGVRCPVCDELLNGLPF